MPQNEALTERLMALLKDELASMESLYAERPVRAHLLHASMSGSGSGTGSGSGSGDGSGSGSGSGSGTGSGSGSGDED